MNKFFKSKINVLVAISLFAFAPVSNALAIDEIFYSGNDILFYDKDSAFNAERCSTSATSTSLTGSDNEEKAWNFFIGKGLTPQQAAGIIGNLQVESSMDPTIKQHGGGPGRGLAQWTENERWQDLKDWADGRDIWALDTQLDFIWHELQTTEKNAYNDLKSTSTIEGATRSFLEKYERAGIPHIDNRIAAANEAYGRYAADSGGGGGSSAPKDGEKPAPSTSTNSGCASSAAGSGDIVAVAAAELGVTESPLNCDAGNPSIKGDCGEGVNKYTDNTLEYWCGDFVSWVYKQAGHPFTGGASGGWRIPGVSNIAAWFKQNGVYTPNGSSAEPKPGDVYFIGGSHVGIVEKVENGTLYTISGNTGVNNTGNGNGVGRRAYQNYKSNSSITGFGSLKG